MIKKNKTQAFTLIELVISSLIIACVSVVVYSVFSGGISAWKKGRDIKDYERSLRLISEVMAREIRNTIRFSSIPFEGDEGSVFFAGIIEDVSAEKESMGNQPGRISYFLNEENTLCRKQQTYAEVFQKEEDLGQIKELIPNLARLSFSYLGFDDAAKEYIWKNRWPDIKIDDEEQSIEPQDEGDHSKNAEIKESEELYIPRAVKIELELKKEPQEDTLQRYKTKTVKSVSDNLKFTKTIMIPLGDDMEEEAR